MTVVINQDGEFASHWGMRDFSIMPDKEKALRLIRALTSLYESGGKKYLLGGRMIASPKVECESVSMPAKEARRTLVLPAILWSAWEAEDRSRALILVNPHDEDKQCRVGDSTITIPALSGIIAEI